MAKKTFTSGLDALLTPTTEQKRATPLEKKSKAKDSQPSETLISLLIRIPVDLKIKLDIYCAQNRITKQNFITALITEILA